MPDESFKKYNHAQAIRQQIKHVNHLVSEADMEDRQSFQRYFNKSFMALSSLEAMIKPFSEDGEFESKLEDFNPAENTRSEKLTVIRDALDEIMQFLYNENLFYAQRQGRQSV